MSEVLRATVVVVGAGPAGIAAACLLGEAGVETLLVDEGVRPGGQIWRHRVEREAPAAAREWLHRLEATPVRRIHETSIIDARSDGLLLGETRDGSVTIKGDKVILATGARERFLPFPGWTLPGVLGVGAAQALVKAGGEVAGAVVVLAGSGPLLLPVARLLRRSGGKVKLIAEQAPSASIMRFAAGLWRQPAKLKEAAQYRLGTLGTPYRFGIWATLARGEGRVEEVELTDGQRSWTETCDLLCCAYGLVPNTEIARWLGCESRDEAVAVDEFQRTSVDPYYCVGESTGIGGVDLSIAEGRVAGAHIAERGGPLETAMASRDRLREFSARLSKAFSPRPELRERVRPETLICRCEDVPWQSLDPAWTMRQAKLYTRLGMGPCQGRVCGAAMGYLCGWESDTVRPPLKPCRLESLSSIPRASD